MKKEMLLKTAAELHQLGFAIHWIKPNSKAPVKSGWTGGTRDNWKTLVADYRDGYGVGVRLGAPSKLKDGSFLASLDIDIKSSDPKHRNEALAVVEKKWPGLLMKAPVIVTGYGLRLFVKTRTPSPSRKITASPEAVKVLMPTAAINGEQRKLLTESELEKGLRIRKAWEIEFMSAGKQVVLPPSIHPDTGKPYKWGGNGQVKNAADIPYLGGQMLEGDLKLKNKSQTKDFNFDPVEVDLLDSRLSSGVVDLICGHGVEDRSAAAFTISRAMVKEGFSDTEILSLLTDQSLFIGQMPYDHRKTSNRNAAAAWVKDYCLAKAKENVSPGAVFEGLAVEQAPKLSADEAKAQKAQLVGNTPWHLKIQRSGKNGEGPPKPTIKNIILILENAVSPKLFMRDIFAGRDFYGANAPWTGGTKNVGVTDDDAINIKNWLAQKFGFEPAVGTIFEAITVIATRNQFHPVRTEIEELEPWDGTPRLDSWLKLHFQAEGPDEYLAQVFRKWLVASVTRTFEPGAKFDWMPIFEGAQGTGKSSFGAILFGQKYFGDWLPNLADKDAALGLLGKRCIEFAELDRMRRSEIDTVKAFVTRQVDTVRPPYGRKSVEYFRGSVFFGTTNRKEYLQDDTGNRRFNPVQVGWLDFKALERDRDQLWAEAYAIYQFGAENLYLDNGADKYAKEIQQQKLVQDESDLMAGQLLDFLDLEMKKEKSERFDFSEFQLEKLFGSMGPLQIWKYDAKHARFAAKALRTISGDSQTPVMFTNHKKEGRKYWRINPGTFWGPGDPRGP